jgi:hypothetical protein
MSGCRSLAVFQKPARIAGGDIRALELQFGAMT